MLKPGLSPEQCRAALLHLLNTTRTLRDAPDGVDLAALREQLDRELALRTTVEAQLQMSPTEAVVLEPTLRRLRIALQATSRSGVAPAAVATTLATIAESGLARLTAMTTAARDAD